MVKCTLQGPEIALADAPVTRTLARYDARIDRVFYFAQKYVYEFPRAMHQRAIIPR